MQFKVKNPQVGVPLKWDPHLPAGFNYFYSATVHNILMRQILDTDQKALEINLNPRIYGTFAEIGAGQEVARHFFKVGAAAGTIAKSMSAYDKTISDRIYGEEASGRYVCESRLMKMLDHEYSLLTDRLSECRPDNTFFTFADTVAALNFHHSNVGMGWLGLRFQLQPDTEPNDLILHVRMYDNDSDLQKGAIGLLGVNMLYACYHYYEDPEQLIISLMENLAGRIAIDLVQLTGPDFAQLDNRLLGLYLLKHKFTTVVMFDEAGKPIHPSEFLYKKSLMVIRGNYRPPTKVTVDVFNASFDLFHEHIDIEGDESLLMAELTLDNLTEGERIDEKDYLDRMDCLKKLNHKVILSDCSTHRVLLKYLSDYKIKNLGLVIGSKELLSLIMGKYENFSHGSLLMAFGELFSRNLKIFVYPAWDHERECILTSKNLSIPDDIKHLYNHFLANSLLIDVEDYVPEDLRVLPIDVLKAIQTDRGSWHQYLPEDIANAIRQNGMFGYSNESFEHAI